MQGLTDETHTHPACHIPGPLFPLSGHQCCIMTAKHKITLTPNDIIGVQILYKVSPCYPQDVGSVLVLSPNSQEIKTVTNLNYIQFDILL